MTLSPRICQVLHIRVRAFCQKLQSLVDRHLPQGHELKRLFISSRLSQGLGFLSLFSSSLRAGGCMFRVALDFVFLLLVLSNLKLLSGVEIDFCSRNVLASCA